MKFTISFILDTDLTKKEAYEKLQPTLTWLQDILQNRFDCTISPLSVAVTLKGDESGTSRAS